MGWNKQIALNSDNDIYIVFPAIGMQTGSLPHGLRWAHMHWEMIQAIKH